MWPWRCERRCGYAITSSPTTAILLAGDRVLSARCDAAIEGEGGGGDMLWEAGEGEEEVLMASCTELERTENGVVRAKDCVNGTLVRRYLPIRDERLNDVCFFSKTSKQTVDAFFHCHCQVIASCRPGQLHCHSSGLPRPRLLLSAQQGEDEHPLGARHPDLQQDQGEAHTNETKHFISFF